MVRKGHLGHTKAQICPVLHGLCKSERAADNEAELRSAGRLCFRNKLRHSLARHLPALNAHGDYIRIIGDGAQDVRRLFIQCGAYLFLRGVIGKSDLLGLYDFKAAERLQALCIFTECVDIKALSHFADTYKLHVQHPAVPRRYQYVLIVIQILPHFLIIVHSFE